MTETKLDIWVRAQIRLRSFFDFEMDEEAVAYLRRFEAIHGRDATMETVDAFAAMYEDAPAEASPRALGLYLAADDWRRWRNTAVLSGDPPAPQSLTEMFKQEIERREAAREAR